MIYIITHSTFSETHLNKWLEERRFVMTQIEDWVTLAHGNKWNNFCTCLTDMVSVHYGGLHYILY